MECLKCGATVVEENAVYCCACGARLDGKKDCPACGEQIDVSSTYCVYCGALTECKDESTKQEGVVGKRKEGYFLVRYYNIIRFLLTFFFGWIGSFVINHTRLKPQGWKSRTCAYFFLAPLTGGIYGLVASVANLTFKASADGNVGYFSTNKIVEKPKKEIDVFAWIRSGAGLACALFALIFVFLIGYTMQVTGSKQLIEMFGATEESKNLFHYFGDAYKDIADIKDAKMFESQIPVTAAYIYAILGTVISALTIVGVVGFAVPAIIGFVKFAMGGEENNGAKWGVRSALVFLGGAAAMYTLDVMNMRLSYAGVRCNAQVAYNGATKAGIILCIIFLAIYAVGNLIRKGKGWKSGKTIAFYALTVCAAAFAIVVFAVDKSGFVGSKIIVAGETLLSGTFSQFYNNVMLVSMAELTAGAEFYNEHVATISTSFAFSIAQQVLLMATLVCGVALIGKYACNTEDKKSALWLSICLAVFAVAQLVCGIICQSSFHTVIIEMAAAGDMLKCKLQLGKAIVAVVFALLNLGVQIAQKAVVKNREEIA